MEPMSQRQEMDFVDVTKTWAKITRPKIVCFDLGGDFKSKHTLNNYFNENIIVQIIVRH